MLRRYLKAEVRSDFSELPGSRSESFCNYTLRIYCGILQSFQGISLKF